MKNRKTRVPEEQRVCGNCRWLHPISPQFYSTKEPQVPWCWATPHHEQRGQTWPACALWEGKVG